MVFKTFLFSLLVLFGGAANALININILTVYSPGAANAFGGFNGASSNTAVQIAVTNTVLNNSGIGSSNNGVMVTSVGTLIVLNPDLDLNPVLAIDKLESNFAVAKARDLNNADVVILINNYNVNVSGWNTQGIAGQYNPNLTSLAQKASTAFAVVTLQSLPSYTYQHELGHILGAEHQIHNPAIASPNYAYPLMVLYGNNCYVTIMYSDPATGCTQTHGGGVISSRIGQYSTYGFPYNSAWGDSTHNNARRILEIAPTVAQYHTIKLLKGMTVRLLTVPMFIMLQ